MAEKLKITYATLSDSNEEIHKGYEAGLAEARTLLGASYGNFINGKWITDGATFEKRTPIDGSLVGTFTKGDRSTAKSAIAAAKAAYPAWSARPAAAMSFIPGTARSLSLAQLRSSPSLMPAFQQINARRCAPLWSWLATT